MKRTMESIDTRTLLNSNFVDCLTDNSLRAQYAECLINLKRSNVELLSLHQSMVKDCSLR